MMLWSFICVVLAVCPSVLVATEPRNERICSDFTGSDAYAQLRHDGFDVVQQKQLPLDNDRDGVFVVAKRGEGLALFVYGCEDSKLVLLARSTSLPGEELSLFETIELGRRLGILFRVMEDSPDEAVFNESVFLVNPSGIYPVLKSRWQLRHSEAEAGRQPVEVVDLGGLPLGLVFEPGGQAAGWPVAVLRSSPKVLELTSHSTTRTEVVIGSYTEVFTRGKIGYEPAFKGFEEYISPVGELSVHVRDLANGSAQCGTSGGGTTGADAGSGWSVDAAGNELEVSWKRPVAVCAVMLQFCKGDTWRTKRFSLLFPGGQKIQLDDAKPDAMDNRLLGFGNFKSPDGITSTLVFFRKPILAKSFSFRSGRSGLVDSGICIAKITPLTCLKDRSLRQEKRPHGGP